MVASLNKKESIIKPHRYGGKKLNSSSDPDTPDRSTMATPPNQAQGQERSRRGHDDSVSPVSARDQNGHDAQYMPEVSFT